MMDPIVDEVRRIRDEHAARFDYDLRAIFLDIKKCEKERGLVFLEGVAHQPRPVQPREVALAVLPVTPSIQADSTIELERH